MLEDLGTHTHTWSAPDVETYLAEMDKGREGGETHVVSLHRAPASGPMDPTLLKKGSGSVLQVPSSEKVTTPQVLVQLEPVHM